jgi:para-nitrobenzyl esterase
MMGSSMPAQPGDAAVGPVVATPAGLIRGIDRAGVSRFAGIRFAAAPVGELRFRPPAPAPPWEGELDATGFGPVSPQNPSMMDALFGGEAERWDEDCLRLNVWTTAVDADGGRSGDLRPVMVWIHGGAFEMGSGSSPLYHGDRFAREGVVYVSINYRLGSLGFLELGGLDPSLAGSGNVGLLDQVAALEWVRDNISAFGGDPGNVTVFGESAGAMSVSLLLTMPSARGLFHKAIVQSGSLVSCRPADLARSDAAEFMALGGWAGVDDLLAADVTELLAAHASMGAARISAADEVLAEAGTALAALPFRPVGDGVAVPEDPLAAVGAGCAAGIPLVIGTNLEEWKLFALMTPQSQDEEALLVRMGLVADDPAGCLATYREQHPGASPADLESALFTDLVFRIPAVRLADAQSAHAPVWQYRFDWRSPALGGLLGASHSVEIPFVFDMIEDHRLHVLVGAEAPLDLARSMHSAWVSVAASGTPAGAGLDWPALPGPGGDGRPVLCLDLDTTVQDDPEGLTRRFWGGTA